MCRLTSHQGNEKGKVVLLHTAPAFDGKDELAGGVGKREREVKERNGIGMTIPLSETYNN